MYKKNLLVTVVVIIALTVTVAYASTSKSLTISQYIYAASRLGLTELAPLKAVDTVESGGYGFLADGRPKILYERHLFHRYTTPVGRWDARYPDISNAIPGGYLGGSLEYTRLAKAQKLNSTAALMSASWGRFQILGRWYAICGYASPAKYAAAMYIHEKYHLYCLVSFLHANPSMIWALKHHNWTEFARRYNGPSYARNNYHIKLAAAYTAAVKAGWNKYPIPVARADAAAVSDTPNNHDSHLPAGAVAAIVVCGVIAAIALAAIIVVLLVRRNLRRQRSPTDYKAYAVNDSA